MPAEHRLGYDESTKKRNRVFDAILMHKYLAVSRLKQASHRRLRRYKGSLSFNLDDHPSVGLAVNFKFNLFVLFGAKKRCARGVLCGDDAQIMVVLVAREFDNANPGVAAHLYLYAVADLNDHSLIFRRHVG